MKQLSWFDLLTPATKAELPQQKVFALVDCNNFYVSCERVFNATLQLRPVIVLGNNDGCIVARSQEAKALGIQMGMPFWKVKRVVERHQIAVYSSNYALYQDMSDRVMQILSTQTSALEVYSIDEAYLDVSHIPLEMLADFGHALREQVEQWTGIPLSIGFAPTKVLAKLACELRNVTESIRGFSA